MDVHEGIDHGARVSTLVRQLIDEHDPKYGVGSITCSVYDTAWVAMIPKTIHGQTQWLFPASFQYLLVSQRHDGGWHDSSVGVDGILNTLAALLALCKHVAAPYQISSISKEDLQHRQTRAVYYLEAKFGEWDVATTQPSGFELLVPKLLQLLAQEGVDFCVPGKDLLMDLRNKTAVKFHPSTLYNKQRTSAAQCLEGLIGDLNFDKISQHKISGSMMASPASTAAYLIHSSTWDDEAESYLSHIISVFDEKSGGVPSRYPSTVSEVTGALPVLLENGFDSNELGSQKLEDAAAFLEDCLCIDTGVTGFAPFVESDADNTAKAISTLRLLGKSPSPQGLILRFETQNFFKTFTQDRTPRFSTNCLVLKALLDLLPGNGEQMPQVEKTIKFIANRWSTTNGNIHDESNVSLTYPLMLMINSFTRLANLWEQGVVPVLDDLILKDKVFLCLFQALTRLMQTQNSDGSWGQGRRCETTAYAILSLTKLASFSSAPRVKSRLTQAIETGRLFLSHNFHPICEPDQVWTGKTTSGSSILFQAYVLAALHAPLSGPVAGQSLEKLYEIPLARIVIQTKYYNKQQWFANVPIWQVQACLVESYLFLPQLRDLRFAVFPSASLNEDRYFDSVPFTWIAANTINGRLVGSEYLFRMMILSLFNRQLEDYIENVIDKVFAGCLFEVEELVYGIFEELQTPVSRISRSESHEDRSSTSTNYTSPISETQTVLRRFISRILNHPCVLEASKHDRDQVQSELLAFLLGRISQLSSKAAGETIINQSGAPLVSKTATDQTDHPYTFAFLACLVGNRSPFKDGVKWDFLDSSEQQYLAADLCRHLSIISFMSNTVLDDANSRDHPPQCRSKLRSISIGSSRDSSSRSVSPASTTSSYYTNGGDSPVSALSSNTSAPSTPASVDSWKSLQYKPKSTDQAPSQSLQLSRLLSHERKCLNICLDSLAEAGINQSTADIIGLFVDFSELSEQIYADPNIGSYQPTTAAEVIERACILDPHPSPPMKGLVSTARSTMTLRPPTSQYSLRQSFLTGDGRTLTGGQETPKPPVIPEQHIPTNTSPSTPANRASRIESEAARIERIMHEMDSWPIPKPKVNPMLKGSLRQAPSEGSLRSRVTSDAQKADTDDLKLVRARNKTQKRVSDEASRRVAKAMKARAVEEAKVQRRRASGLQAKAMEEAWKFDDQGVRRAVTVDDSKGWVKAPPAVVFADTPWLEEGKQAGKLKRVSKLGYTWKAPF